MAVQGGNALTVDTFPAPHGVPTVQLLTLHAPCHELWDAEVTPGRRHSRRFYEQAAPCQETGDICVAMVAIERRPITTPCTLHLFISSVSTVLHTVQHTVQ